MHQTHEFATDLVAVSALAARLCGSATSSGVIDRVFVEPYNLLLADFAWRGLFVRVTSRDFDIAALAETPDDLIGTPYEAMNRICIAERDALAGRCDVVIVRFGEGEA